MAQIDEMVRPILAHQGRMGLFEHPYVDEGLLEKVVALPEHRQASRLAAQRSMVLLATKAGCCRSRRLEECGRDRPAG